MRKSLTFEIVFLLICSIFIPLSLGLNVKVSQIQQPSNFGNGNTLYVGGDGPGNYSKIQDAIDNASNDDTVFVYDDSSPYYESISINKRINLIGEDKNTTIIDGGNTGTAVKLDWVSGVIIDGFTIQNSGISQGDTGVGGVFFSSLIKSNIISDNNYGIKNMFITGYPGMGQNKICNNIVTNNIYGIKIESSFNKIYDNQIVNNNYYGIQIEPSSLPTDNIFLSIIPTDNEVYRNTISDNKYAIEISISNKNKIFENNIKNNGAGISIFGGFGDSINNSIYKNNFLYNERGIKINCQREGGYNNKVYQNNFYRNKRNAYFVGNGKNTWNENYWNHPRKPYLIIGLIQPFDNNIFIPWFQIDYNPAQKPYDIKGYYNFERIDWLG